MNKVYVMLSTYNGQKYLKEQIDSILGQEEVNVQLLVRDDGSSDSTCDILKQYEKVNSNIKVYYEENIGYIKSFLKLVQYAGTEQGAYYSFSDQDDIWEKNKLIAAIRKMDCAGEEEPVMYYSDLKVVDKDDHFIRMANSWEGTIDKYMLAMFIGIRGCTMVHNNSLQQLLLRYQPGKISGHDTYVALLAFWSGRVVYDSNAYIHYRQTGENLSITGTSKWDKIYKNFVYLKKRMTTRSNIHELNAKAVLDGYADVVKEREKLEKVAYYKKSWKTKIALLREKDFFHFSFIINAFNIFLLTIGKL
jgi:rhamnosyltransferase